MNAKLAIMTGTRAEYGIFRPLLREFQARDWPFELYVTGMHLSQRHGWTVQEIEADGFAVDERVDILLSSDSGPAICKSMGLALTGFGELLARRLPDLLFVLGDRFEAFAVAAAAQVIGIPIAHLHGGESTEGLIDEAFRHSITKMSQLHFVATEEYRRRVIQLGEEPSSVHYVGALGLDNIAAIDVLNREQLEAEIGFRFRALNMLITYHPLTLDLNRSRSDLTELVAALSEFDEAGIIITAPNADTGGSAVIDILHRFAAERADRVKVVSSLGTRRYFSVLRTVNVVVGNSSSGLIEVPSFGIPTVNIGDRQKGRIAGPSVITAAPERVDIRRAIDMALSPAFRERLAAPNPYGSGSTAKAIADTVAQVRFPVPLQKPFHNHR